MAGRRKHITFVVTSEGCHECTSHTLKPHGYPCLWKNGRGHNMHRVLYEEAGNVIPDGQVVRHTCDNPKCINLEHLIVGTRADNTQDMMSRKRHRCQRGESHTDATLSNADVLAIQAAEGTQAIIAAAFGVNQSTVSRIKNAKRRKDILCK